ncbi:cellobiohydrolase A [Rhodococcus opacus M213]|uniref:Cellobiohydrolase A n=1 Tax=Rhodococcus opacus M213 TaxID=1129896 RepID=K8XIL2_RHOOP|nr:cellobiohydrolase A [Rhodococcus opacus M213]
MLGYIVRGRCFRSVKRGLLRCRSCEFRHSHQHRDLPDARVVERDGRIGLLGRVDERHEPRQLLRVLEHARPLVLVSQNVLGHGRLQIGGDAQAVLAHHGLEVVEPALEGIDPRRGALETIRGADVEHEVPVDVADQGLVVEPTGEQLGVLRRLAAVAADVQVPAVFGGDDADVLAARLGAFAGAARDTELDLVRGPQAAVSVLQVDRHTDGVLHAVSAPGGSDAALHGAQRLAVGLTGLHARVDETLPDRGQLLDAGAEQVDALTAGDLRVQAEVAGHLADDDELFGGAFAAGHPRHHGVGAVLLDVGQEVVVRVLQTRLVAVQDVVRVGGREDRCDYGLADVAARTLPVLRDQRGERARVGGLHDLEQLGAGLLEVLAQRLGHHHAGRREELLDGRQAAAARRSRVGAALDLRDVAGTVGDGPADRTLGDAVAGAHLGVVGQGPGAGLLPRRRDQRGRIARQLTSDERAQRRIGGGVADEDAAEQRLRVVGHDQLGVGALGGVAQDHLQGSRRLSVRVAEAGDVHTHQLELGGQVRARELRSSAQQPVRDDLRGGVTGSDEAIAPSLHRGALADRVDVLVRRAAAEVRDDPAPLTDLESGIAGQLVLRPHTRGEHQQRGLDHRTVGQLDADPVRTLGDARGADTRVDGETQVGDQVGEQRSAAVVHLQRHQPGRELDDVRCHAHQLEGVRGLESEQATADDDTDGAGSGRVDTLPDAVEVVERAVDEALRPVVPGDRRHERVRTGGHHESVVRDDLTRIGGDLAGLPIDGRGPAADPEIDESVVRVVVTRERKLLGVPRPHIGGQSHPVVRGEGLLAEHRHRPVVRLVARTQRLDESMSDHSVPDDHC